jgi:divalent metal cation (Fe/Co/Zn/Cd) transporter
MMKAIRLITLTLGLALLMTFNADAKNKPESVEDQLRDKITQLISRPDLKLVPLHERSVSVEFIVTRENKLVVLEIDTYNDVLEKYIKKKLNYKKVAVKGVQKMLTYRVDLSFVPGS